jgi:HCOMODA/2-hydroxy-3-carboxy-muconic semialdehyde decarboxylase
VDARAGHRLRARVGPRRGVDADHARRRPGHRHGVRRRGRSAGRFLAAGGRPAEAWIHLALYRARPDAGAVARAQPAGAIAAAATTTSLAPLHGQAAWLGESVPVHDSAHLLRSAELAERAARALPVGEALLLRGNGALTVGATPGVAVARMWLLSAACDAFVAARAAGQVTPLTVEEIASWRAVGDELLPRLWRHLRRPERGPA